jgi:hypothetical protein
MPPLSPPDYPYRPDAPLLSFGPVFSEYISHSTMDAVWPDKNEDPHHADIRIAAALTMLEGFHPRDHLECMLASMGVAFFVAEMECLAEAIKSDTPLADACKLRASAAQMHRCFSRNLTDLGRLQARPLPGRPGEEEPPPPGPVSGSGSRKLRAGQPRPSGLPIAARFPAMAASVAVEPDAPALAAPGDPLPDDPLPDVSAPDNSAPDESAPGASAPADSGPGDSGNDAEPPELINEFELERDMETRPDGTPGSLRAYAPKPPPPEFVPGDSALTIALATRPKEWRMVNAPTVETDANAAPPVAPQIRPEAVKERMDTRLPLDLSAKYLLGGALSNLLTARFDPDAPVPPPDLEEDTVVELELISTGGDPELEAEKLALMAAHPEGKPIRIIRLAGQAPHDELPNKPPVKPPD